jgi:hypothetical protein
VGNSAERGVINNAKEEQKQGVYKVKVAFEFKQYSTRVSRRALGSSVPFLVALGFFSIAERCFRLSS